MLKLRYLVLLALAFLLLAGCNRAGVLADTQQVRADFPVPSPTAKTGSDPVSDTSASTPVSPMVNPTEAATSDACLDCHANKQKLIESSSSDESDSEALIGLGWSGELPEMESWEKVLVNRDRFIPTVHGRFPCTSCHGGNSSEDKDIAHKGLNPNPSQGPEVVCGECHPDIAHTFENSLHSTVRGFMTALDERTVPSDHENLSQMFSANCSTCHNTCGDCHVSQPKSVGGGLYDGHTFQRTPPMDLSCNACHGSRVSNEFIGKNAGLPPDLHYLQANMNCLNCHTGREMHGDPGSCNSCHPGPESASLPLPDGRYDGVQSPRCETCHVNVSTGQDDVLMHRMHGSKLSCQVCHSVAYTNCEGCHVSTDELTGNPIHELDESYSAFLIGKNPIVSYDRPYLYVPVRHVPVTPDSFESYGIDLLTNFGKAPTWKYTTPHNIQLRTPQSKSCNSCHGNQDLFLTADKLSGNELIANEDVIVDQIPPRITSGDQIP
jgi:thiosulfate/3-mercaptopyruvate sulfurtransferase